MMANFWHMWKVGIFFLERGGWGYGFVPIYKYIPQKINVLFRNKTLGILYLDHLLLKILKLGTEGTSFQGVVGVH